MNESGVVQGGVDNRLAVHFLGDFVRSRNDGGAAVVGAEIGEIGERLDEGEVIEAVAGVGICGIDAPVEAILLLPTRPPDMGV